MTTNEVTDAFAAWGSYDRDNPFPLFAEVLARGPVHAVTLVDGHAAYLVAGYDEAKALLNDRRLSKDMLAAFASGCDVVAEGLPGPALARHMLAVDPPDHTRLRRLVAAAFSVRRIEALAPRVQTLIDELLDAVAARGPDTEVDLVTAFAFPLPFTVICELLGVPEPDREPFGTELRALLAPTTDDLAERERASGSVVAMLDALVANKRAQPDDALVSALIDARDGDERLDTQELLSTIFQLIVAGHDTTTTLISNGLVALLTNPDQFASLRADPTLLHAAIEEFLRFDSPVPHATFRYATEPIDIGGTTIPAGAQVIVALAAANRDPRHTPEPERLAFDRPDSQHLAFGHGIHFCLGAPLARMEAQLAFTTLFARFPGLRLAVPIDALHWGHGDGLVLRGLSALPVFPGPSSPMRNV